MVAGVIKQAPDPVRGIRRAEQRQARGVKRKGGSRNQKRFSLGRRGRFRGDGRHGRRGRLRLDSRRRRWSWFWRGLGLGDRRVGLRLAKVNDQGSLWFLWQNDLPGGDHRHQAKRRADPGAEVEADSKPRADVIGLA